jgi:hypothetical protein
MLKNYPVRCTRPGCDRLALYKIAARWSDGATQELKTYALSCEECLPQSFHLARVKQAECRTAKGETLEPPGVYVLSRGRHDQELERRADLEESLTAAD